MLHLRMEMFKEIVQKKILSEGHKVLKKYQTCLTIYMETFYTALFYSTF